MCQFQLSIASPELVTLCNAYFIHLSIFPFQCVVHACVPHLSLLQSDEVNFIFLLLAIWLFYVPLFLQLIFLFLISEAKSYCIIKTSLKFAM